MKKILIVEDQPELKVEMLLKLLESDKIKFEYEIVKSVTSAKRYLHKRANEVDVIIMDLGLPIFDGELVTNLLEGVHLIYDLEDFDVKVPVVINSTTSKESAPKSSINVVDATILLSSSIPNCLNILTEVSSRASKYGSNSLHTSSKYSPSIGASLFTTLK